MKNRTIGELIFWGAVASALALYFATMPDGLPWNESMRLAMASSGTGLPHPIWGFYVKVFGGPIFLAISLAALAAGLLGAVVNRYFGWRFAVSAALVWIFLPGVWNRAITGERGIVLAAMAVVAVWVMNWIALWATRKARAARKSVAEGGGGLGETALSGVKQETKRGKVNRIAGWVALGAAGLFAVVSVTMHDYKLGEAASVYAKGVVEAAGDRVIVLNGVVDEQIEREVYSGVGNRCRCAAEDNFVSAATLSLRNDEANRAEIVAWAKREWPGETNLWVAATVSPQAFVDAATKGHPERFYLMNGASATHEQWEARWEAFKPYLETSDRFVRVARRLFGYEGNSIANAMLEEPKSGVEVEERNHHSSTSTKNFDFSTAAWQLYKRIYTEVDPGNLSALVNMSEMIRRGYGVSGDEKKRVREKLETFFKDANNRRYAQRIVRASGPIRADPALMEQLAAEAKKRIAAKVAAGEKVELAPEILSLIEWNNEMVELMNKGELVRAGRIARAILSNPKWRGFIPANAIMGTVASSEGDYVASERFFRAATDATNKVAAATLNDYADTLMHLGKFDEAEKVARRAVAQTDAKAGWICRLTLAEVLKEKAGEGVENRCRCTAEIKELLKSVLKYAPREAREKIRKEFPQ